MKLAKTSIEWQWVSATVSIQETRILMLWMKMDTKVGGKNNLCQRGSPNTLLEVTNYVSAQTALIGPYDRTRASRHVITQISCSAPIIDVKDEGELSRPPLTRCIRLVPAQDVPYALILWYVLKIIYSSQEQDQFAIKSLNLFFDLIALIIRAFIVRYQYYTINYIYIIVTKSEFFFGY